MANEYQSNLDFLGLPAMPNIQAPYREGMQPEVIGSQPSAIIPSPSVVNMAQMDILGELPRKEVIPTPTPAVKKPASGGLPMKNPWDILSAEQQALRGSAKAAMNEAKETSKFLKEMTPTEQEMKSLDAEAKRLRDEQEKQRQAYEMNYNEFQKANEEFGNLKINNNRWWSNKSTGDKVLAGIAVFLGGLGGGQNNALKIIDSAIERDIQEQKTNLDIKGQRLQNQRGLLPEMRARLGDLTAAENATRAIYAQGMQNNLQAIAAKYNSPKIAAQAEIAIQDLELKKQGYIQQAIDNARTMEARSILGGGTDTPPMMEAALEQLSKSDPTIRERFVYSPKLGIQGVARTAEGRKALVESSSDTATAMDMIDQLIGLGRKTGREFLPSEAKAVAGQLQDLIVGKMRLPITGPGAMTDSEREFLKGVVGNPTDIMQVNSQARLKNLKKTLMNAVQQRAKLEGLKVDSGAGQILSETKFEGKIK